MEESTVYLTQEAFDKLKEELAWREGEYREEITSRISTARAEGDLSENGGYQAAREEQGKNEGRINELTVKLRQAQIVEAPKAGIVGNGSLVTLDFAGMEQTYVIGSRENTVASDYEVMSAESPIGAAILGAHTGDTVSYQVPSGKTMSVTIKDARPLD